MDRVEIRRRNLIPPDAFPYDHEILFQDFRPLVYDSGNYPAALAKAVEMIGYDQFLTTEQPRHRRAGRHVGIGVVSYIEGTGIGPYEGARVQVQGDDGVHFEATVVASQFAGKLPLARHRMVYATLGELMGGAIHALALKTLTPEEAAARR